MLKVGDVAPEFTLPDQSGQPVSLAVLRGKPVVLFFYPKADTSGCTVEACGFRDSKAEFDRRGVVLLGMSPDAPKAQGKFAVKYDLPMQLLADEQHQVAEKYGVWAEKSMYGRKYMGIERTTFVIGPDGKLLHIFRKVKPDGHAVEVLKALETGT
jgi:thioredoxin-dependent peroxiredoxin